MSAARTPAEDAPANGVFTLAPGLSFLDALAAGALARCRDDATALAGHTILLPTRRACRGLEDAFLRQAGGRGLLLPAIRPLGDIDEEALAELAGLHAAEAAAADLPPAIAPLKRRLLLAREVLRWAEDHGYRQGGARLTADQAARLAESLTQLLDRMQTERIGFSALERLVPDDYAAHWQETLDFLHLLAALWPERLERESLLDPAERRNRALEALARRWRQAPPPGPVIAAGSTGSIPATADLLATIAKLPQGQVVLPGLDRTLADALWQTLEPSHPQAGLKQLLERLGIEREAVADWPTPSAPAAPRARTLLLSAALQPPAPPVPLARGVLEEALAGITRIDCAHPREEAAVIALILREALEHRHKRAALVTFDRKLAQRVVAELGRYGIVIDDSAGRPLRDTPPGVFLRLIATATARAWAPRAFLAVLKHPLAAAGLPRRECLERARAIERRVLRGPRPAPGLAGIKNALVAAGAEGGLVSFIAALEAMAAPFDAALADAGGNAATLVAGHAALAEALAAEDGEPGAARLWRGEAGEEAARFIAQLAEAAAALGPLPGRSYPALFEELIAGPVVRSPESASTRLFIWGPLEARLQHVERMVLGGLNEGVWPPEAEADPWMSRAMRLDLGLPAPERRVGLSAHDFVHCAHAPEVFLTRARKDQGTPTVPARWLVRLEALIEAHGAAAPARAREAERWLAWQRALDRPDGTPAAAPPPAPRPPLAARPRRLSVTEIGTWLADPYAIYARHVLGLEPLHPIDADFGAAERGEFVHRALETFTNAHPGPPEEDALERLLEEGRSSFGAAFGRTAVWAFWWPRFEAIARWFVDEQRRRHEEGLRVRACEIKGTLRLEAAAGGFELRGKADRIDATPQGEIEIIDYKTGSLPTKLAVDAGLAPQLALEGLIAEAGGFGALAPARVVGLSYWHLSGGAPAGKVRDAGGSRAAELIAEARAGLARLIAAFDDPRTPYHSEPDPENRPAHGAYAHLARVREWRPGGEDES